MAPCVSPPPSRLWSHAGPKRSRERREAQELPLYDGCNFHFHAGTTAFSTEVSMLQTLASGAGGAIVSRPELDAAAASQDDGSSTRLFVVVADDSEDDLSGFAEVCIVVEESFIIESLEGYEALDANKYVPARTRGHGGTRALPPLPAPNQHP